VRKTFQSKEKSGKTAKNKNKKEEKATNTHTKYALPNEREDKRKAIATKKSNNF